MMIDTVSGILCIVLCFIAAMTDAFTHEIPNLVTFPGILIGAALTLISSSEPLLKILVFALLFVFGPALFGEGDVKLSMMAVMLSGVRIFTCGFIVSQFLILITSILFSTSQVVSTINGLFNAKGRKQELQSSFSVQAYPFAPPFFISIAFIISWRWFR